MRARSCRIARNPRMRVTVRGFVQRVTLGDPGKPVRTPVGSIRVDQNVVLVSAQGRRVVPGRVRLLPDDRRHEIFRAEHLVKDTAETMYFLIVKVDPHGAIWREELLDLQEPVT